ncbi:MAG: hypothetical protein OXT05_02735 [Chloroflexota bacterium]|nr:hypothetical protein [Chloroflexota bacterium]
MNLKMMNRSDILLAIIAAAGERNFSRVYVQKVVFLVSEEYNGKLPEDFYEFDKYHYGPFSSEVYRDAEMLNDLGCISIKYGADRRDDLYMIEQDCYLDDIQLPADLKRYIADTVDWVIDMSFAELVRAIYLLFPEYRENSRFHYEEEQALAESFVRGMRQLRDGKTYSTAEVLAELRKGTASHGEENSLVS